ncbi:peptidase M61 [Maribacter sp. MMG018]|uniref:M61 family metallopeptidase n=1 Tax=Maribacter sp. MMG018 TaxID=2822688 RepID=UPI001B37FFDC|nr:peptidase M61 [Maribacter sp. MMG018]MBQ4913962.1 peptidase M61 [Maribacter sp. MMG018]
MKKIIGYVIVLFVIYSCGGGKSLVALDKSPIMVHMDLVDVTDDKVAVIIDPGAFSQDEISFRIPKTVPGTYSSDDYGKYVENFVAYDYKGKEMMVSKLDANTWKIADARNLDKVNYFVNDTYDTENEVSDAVFSPAGTNILEGENYMLNLHGFVGYFDGYKEVPYFINIKKPEDLIATTTLANESDIKPDPLWDSFVASRYFEVIDNPIMYAKPNTETFNAGDIEVTISVYSPNGVYKASDLKDRMYKMMNAQNAFLGEMDTTNKYNVLLYLSTMEEDDAMGFGALEHHTSTVVVLPEAMSVERLGQAMVDVVSHEFFHIVTPLSVHSREIQFFDFNDPQMSQHLWMYEGTTEYFANLFQIQQGLIAEDEFYNRLMGKVNNAKSYDDAMSFTTMSQHILEEPYESNYANVYEKGTLINMALDILLREKSNGEKGVLWLMKELSKKYGKETPFEDDKLIDEIVALTYPEVRTFFDTHVIGNTPIDYKMYLSKVGLTMGEVMEETGYFLQGEMPYIDIAQEDGKTIFVRKGVALNSFFTDLNVQGGDVIKSINDTPINLDTMRQVIGQSFGWSPETRIKMVLIRDGEEYTVEGPVGTPVVKVYKIAPAAGASQIEVSLRKKWLGIE